MSYSYNWDMTNNLFENYQLPTGNSSSSDKKQLPIDAVDKMAEELTVEYQNPEYRRWYCGVIYEFGFMQVQEWRKRASEGRQPAKLFSMYARDARTYRANRGSP